MRPLYQAADRIEAQRLVDFLAQHDIEAVIVGDFLSGGIGDLPADIYPVVWLPDNRHWFMASRLLETFLTPDPRADESWICPSCNERVEGSFEVCWNCGQERPE